MPRTVRWIEPNSVYHLISRFVDRQWFITEGEHRATYLRLLGRAIALSDWRCLAYAVMSNHIHLAVVAGEQPLEFWIRRVNSTFADWINRQRGRIGSVFVRGPKDGKIPADRVGALIAYLHNNPVRAGVATRAFDSGWTSHRSYLVPDFAPRWLDVDEGLARAGFTSPSDFDAWVDGSPSERMHVDLSPLARAARKRGAIHVGTPTLSTPVQVPFIIRPWGRIHMDPTALIQAVASELGLSMDVVRSRRKDSRAVAAKRIAVLCGAHLGLAGADVAAALGLTQQAISKHQLRGERDGESALCARVLERLIDSAADAELTIAPAQSRG